MTILLTEQSFQLYNQMSKQLLIIFKILVPVFSLCTISTQIPQLTILTVNFVNMNLNSTSQDYTINLNTTNESSLAIAVREIDGANLIQWNITVSNNISSAVVAYKNANVNWVKVSCILLSSTRKDITLGSKLIEISTSEPKTQSEVVLNKPITNYQTSVVITFLNGYRIGNNQTVELRVKPVRVTHTSFMVNITTTNTQISYIVISFAIFSPIEAKFEAYGGEIEIFSHQQTQFFDVSQDIPNTIYKMYGLSGINQSNSDQSDIGITIDQNYTLASNTSAQIIIQYLYLLPQNYGCSDKCNDSIVYDSTCNKSCPSGTVLINNGQIVFCRNCPESLYLVADKNQANCICKEGYDMNGLGKCIKKNNPKNAQNNTGDQKAMQNSVNCSTVNNSIAVNDKCVCTLGYINVSNSCVLIVTLGTPIVAPNPIVIQPTPFLPFAITSNIPSPSSCLENQSFSSTLNQCVCNIGFQMNASKCVPICSSIENFSPQTKTCVCQSGYLRINSKCVLCSNATQYSTGNETCYPLQAKLYCRNSYINQNNVCISCPGVNISTQINGSCTICRNGYVYNGFECVCLAPNQILNSTCIAQTCGNKKIDTGQSCDDGNTVNGDGCSSLCVAEQGYFCTGAPSFCRRSICGNGIVTGGEQCDDNNTANGDGCSSLCLIQANYSCAGSLSTCIKMQTGNLSLISIRSNTNSIFLIFQTPINYAFPNSAFMQTFLTFKYVTKTITPGTVYCQQDIISLNRFNCLIIFPSGIPMVEFVMTFSYNYINNTGSALVSIPYVPNGARN